MEESFSEKKRPIHRDEEEESMEPPSKRTKQDLESIAGTIKSEELVLSLYAFFKTLVNFYFRSQC